MKTKYFQNSLAVFQGGGCKGIAYAGVLKACEEFGIKFSEVVGVSAGSIIAVLVAAGARYQDILKNLEKLDLSHIYKSKTKNKLSNMCNDVFSIYKVYKYLGIYDSSYIDTFMSQILQQLLDTKKTVKFKDLKMPCSILVSDVYENDSKVYSSLNTPDEDVAKAVQKSCNIPFFFTPLDNRYIDGGLLSNLPIHLLTQNNTFHSKIFAFGFSQMKIDKEPETIRQYLNAITNTVLNGSINIQIGLQSNVNIINIDTGNIKATDFEKIKEESTKQELIQAGYEAVQNFFENEVSSLKENVKNNYVCKDSFETNSLIVSSNDHQYQSITLVDDKIEWIYSLFPTFINWIKSKCTVTLVLEDKTKIKPNEDYDFQIRLLNALGVRIIYRNNIPFRGIVFKGKEDNISQAIVYNSNHEIESQDSKQYFGIEDYDVINSLFSRIEVKNQNNTGNNSLCVKNIPEDDIFKKLRNVDQYKSHAVQIKYQTIEIENVSFLTKYIRGYKLKQIHNILDLYDGSTDVFKFTPKSIIYSNNQSTIITPPIIEKHGSNYFVIEGNTRLFYLYYNKVVRVNCIVIDNVSENLPSSSKYSISELLVTDKTKEGKERYNNFDYSRFRKIEKNMRNPKECLL